MRATPRRGYFLVMSTIALAGLIAIVGGSWVLSLSQSPLHASVVRADIHRTALSQSPTGDTPPGGSIGPWWIAAERLSDDGSYLHNVSLLDDDIMIGARSAQVEVDAGNNTITIQLTGAVVIHESSDSRTGSTTIAHKSMRLGPIDVGIEILEDGMTRDWKQLAQVSLQSQ